MNQWILIILLVHESPSVETLPGIRPANELTTALERTFRCVLYRYDPDRESTQDKRMENSHSRSYHHITWEQGIERPFTSPTMTCMMKALSVCMLQIHCSVKTVQPGTGWPSFYAPYIQKVITDFICMGTG